MTLEHMTTQPGQARRTVRGERQAYRLTLCIVLLAGLALRLFAIVNDIYVIHPDETMQYFEQAHRLAFGAGVVPWEFQDGIRSWLVPGLIAGVMRATSLLSDDPMLYVRAVRVGCAVFSLTVVYVGFCWTYRRYGLAAAALSGSICAVWFELIYFSPTVLTEILSTHAALWALYLGGTLPDDASNGKRRLLAAGAWFGLAMCLRVQYAPALLVGAVWQHGGYPRRWIWLTLGAAITIIPIAGVLDAVTWGAPFRSIWLNVMRNGLQDYSSGFGTAPWSYYPHWVWWTWQAASLLAVVGMVRLPALAITGAAVVVSHELVPHKEYRFIYLALASAPILIGIGATSVTDWLARTFGARLTTSSRVALLGAVVVASWYAGTFGVMAQRFRMDQNVILATQEVHRQPDVCGLGLVLPLADSGGYTYLNRDVPMFARFYAVSEGPSASLLRRTYVVFRGVIMPEYLGHEFLRQTSHFNYVLARENFSAAGFASMACFDDAADPRKPADLPLPSQRRL